MNPQLPPDEEIDRIFAAHGGQPLRAPTEAEMQRMRDNWPHAELPLTKEPSPDDALPRVLQAIAKQAADDVKTGSTISIAVAIVKLGRAGMMSPGTPPSTFLLDLLMAGSAGKDAAANLEDLFPYWEERHGTRKARLIFRVQEGYILAGYWWNRGMNVVERVLNTVKVFTGISGG